MSEKAALENNPVFGFKVIKLIRRFPQSTLLSTETILKVRARERAPAGVRCWRKKDNSPLLLILLLFKL